MSNRVCLPTLDPQSGGGIQSVNKVAYGIAEENGYNPYMVFNALSWENCLTLSSLLRGDLSVHRSRGVFDGMEGIKIGRVLPEFEVFNYLLNKRYWRTALNGADKCLGLGAICLPCLPAAINDVSFGCWIGTTVYDERKSQFGNLPRVRELRDRVTLPITKRYERYTLNRADTILVQSSYTQQRLEELYGIASKETEVVPYPIDTQKFRPVDRKDENEVLFVGRVNDPRKNITMLLDAFARTLAEVPDATLTLVGDQPNERIESRVNELGIGESVDCLGKVADLIPHLNRASVFALSSEQEGLGIAGLEAQSCEIPVVATQCGGPEDYVHDGENGFLVPRGDAEAFSDRLVRILTDERLRERLGENARRTVETEFSEEVIGRKIVETIQELPPA